MRTTPYDIGRAKIDTLLKSGQTDEAKVIAKRMFPQQSRMIDQSLADGNTSLFRDLCHIPEGCEWVDGQYVTGSFRTYADGKPVQIIPSAPDSSAPEPAPIVDPADIVRAFAPAFVFVLCAGGLVVLMLVIAVIAGSILSGFAAGLTRAFTVVGEYLGYIIAGAVGLAVLVFSFSGRKATTPAPRPDTNTSEPGSKENYEFNFNFHSKDSFNNN